MLNNAKEMPQVPWVGVIVLNSRHVLRGLPSHLGGNQRFQLLQRLKSYRIGNLLNGLLLEISPKCEKLLGNSQAVVDALGVLKKLFRSLHDDLVVLLVCFFLRFDELLGKRQGLQYPRDIMQVEDLVHCAHNMV